jgi:NAD(P)-dependent dehydrogenase (short-subunit alcohol dehydrogenase family)
MVQLRPIAEQVVVVFGATSGIGRAAAVQFAQRGARVVVAGRGHAALHAFADELRQAGGEALAVTAEAASYAQVEAVAAAAEAHYGRLDTWVHTAAVSLYAPLAEVTPEEFRQVIEVNLNGSAYGALAALPRLRAGGALIIVSSVEAMVALPYQSAYAASKHGLHGMIKALRLELRHADLPISLTEIMPSTINTPFYSKARTKLGVKPVGVPPIYQPGPVADAILYAAEHPVRELVVGGAGKALIIGERLLPRLVEAFLLRIAFRLQKTDQPKSPTAPDNLEAHLPGYTTVEGDFSRFALRRSAYTWLQMRPALRRALSGAALGLALLARARRGLRREPADADQILSG